MSRTRLFLTISPRSWWLNTSARKNREARPRLAIPAAAITSNIDRVLLGDHLINGWQEAGLLFASVATGIIGDEQELAWREAYALGWTCLASGNLEEAEQHAETARQVATGIGFQRIVLYGINTLLEQVYDEPRRLSALLQESGFEQTDIGRIRQNHLPTYIATVGLGIPGVLADCRDKRISEIVRYRYGLDSSKPMTLAAIGKIYGIYRERVRQLLKRAIRMLKSDKHRRQLEQVIVDVAHSILRGDSNYGN